jgi:uncharacterized cupredoxin-like copper-binding protein
MRTRGRVVLAAAVATLAVVAGACGGDDVDQTSRAAAAEPSQLTVTAHEFNFEASADSVPAGLVEITLENEGKQPHQVQLFRLNDGVEFGTFRRYSTTRGPQASKTFEVSVVAGGVNEISPGEDATATVDLEEGSYALVCFVRGHNTEGMVAPFEVTAAEETNFAAPEPDAEVGLTEFAFGVPTDFVGGTVAFTNSGDQPHEAGLFRLEGATLDEVTTFLEKPTGPPPGKGDPAGQGSISAIPPGETAYADLGGLEPGVYAFVCFVPDQEKLAQGKQVPHFQLGMAHGFEIE